MRILVATDGSSYSEQAIKALLALGPPSDAEVSVLHVVEPLHYIINPAPPPPYHIEWHRVEHELKVEAEETSARAIGQAQQLFESAGIGVKSMVREGHPANEIVKTAHETDADLVVVGSKGLTDSQLALLGDVAQKVARYAPCSVLIVKPAKRPARPGALKIVLATDGSENAREAARFLSSFDLSGDTQVAVLQAVQQPRGLSLSASARLVLEQMRQTRLHDAEDMARATLEFLTTGAQTTTVIREGDPAEQILGTSSKLDADLIVVGSKGLSGIKLFLLGSVSQKVCRYADRSVMVVRMRHGSISAPEGPSA